MITMSQHGMYQKQWDFTTHEGISSPLSAQRSCLLVAGSDTHPLITLRVLEYIKTFWVFTIYEAVSASEFFEPFRGIEEVALGDALISWIGVSSKSRGAFGGVEGVTLRDTKRALLDVVKVVDWLVNWWLHSWHQNLLTSQFGNPVWSLPWSFGGLTFRSLASLLCLVTFIVCSSRASVSSQFNMSENIHLPAWPPPWIHHGDAWSRYTYSVQYTLTASTHCLSIDLFCNDFFL